MKVFKKLVDNSDKGSYAAKMRRKRSALFLSLFTCLFNQSFQMGAFHLLKNTAVKTAATSAESALRLYTGQALHRLGANRRRSVLQLLPRIYSPPLKHLKHTHFKLGWVKRISDPIKARQFVENIQLLRKSDLLALFPGANLYEEKLFGLAKSFIIYDGWVSSQ